MRIGTLKISSGIIADFSFFQQLTYISRESSSNQFNRDSKMHSFLVNMA